MTKTLMNTYNRLPVTFVKGKGVWLWDDNDKQYLDALSGIAVCSLGHAHEQIAQVICEQAGELLHTSNLYGVGHQNRLSERLCALSGMSKAFFCNSGAEANEAAIKIARLAGNKKEFSQPAIIVADRSFHGRTLATLSATGSRKVQAGFEPLVQGFIRVPYNDIEAIQSVADNANQVVAVMVEPVQGEGGVNIPDSDYLNNIRRICDENDWLMILDEIQTGMGRTGEWFAFQHNNIMPDVITLAKALGNGMPVGACLAHGKAAEILSPGTHGTTFGGNPLACRTALAVIDVMSEQNLVKAAAEMGQYLSSAFNNNLKDLKGIVEIRNKGMMIGFELDRPCAVLVTSALEAGLLINVTADQVIRLLPPLIITQDEADILVERLVSLIKTFLESE